MLSHEKYMQNSLKHLIELLTMWESYPRAFAYGLTEKHDPLSTSIQIEYSHYMWHKARWLKKKEG